MTTPHHTAHNKALHTLPESNNSEELLWIRREGDPSQVYYVVRDQDQRITAKWAYNPKYTGNGWHTTGFENDRTGAKLKSIGDWGRLKSSRES